MIKCEDCEFDYCDVLSTYGDKDCYAYIVDAKLKPYKQALEKIKELVTITSQMEHSCATETIFEIINEVQND